jgi:hypothetical protein
LAKAKAPGAGRDQVLEAGLDFRFGRTGGRCPGRISDQILPLTNVGVVDNDNCAMERRLIPAPSPPRRQIFATDRGRPGQCPSFSCPDAQAPADLPRRAAPSDSFTARKLSRRQRDEAPQRFCELATTASDPCFTIRRRRTQSSGSTRAIF